ncbi:hypothetical protein SUVZ_12G0760 [Saccharomyces uvarum]|uniref:Partial AB-hydrolase lipase domain-containing protein n=1 Tax=Saccharomyces uvarum TaxID=230603 RepID=A0ABN8WGJ0_SACUV|nr:hypothetical protein SUVZ_12G0760 [Saccharomyces uvarum]
MKNKVLDEVQRLSSGIILVSFMTGLFILSLWHNYVTVHFQHKHDPRDTRGSRTSIESSDKKKTRPARHSIPLSISSATPIDLERDQDNNIEYDRTVTSRLSMDSNACVSGESDGNDNIKMENNVSQAPYAAENPFQNLALAEDTRLVADLKYYYKQYGIDIEEFEVETDDGFIIDLWHFKPKSEDGVDEAKREPILLLHGLLQSCGAFASSGRKSLAYFLYESGFDIWLGNNRCGLHAKWNMKKLGNDHSKKWDWDMNQMVQYDLKALICHVLDSTGFAKLSLVAHSQGTTQGFMGLVNGEKLYASDFKLVDKLENFVALAPAVYPGPLLDEKSFVRLMANGIDSPWFFGRRSFVPLMMAMRDLMVGTKIFSFLSYVMFNYLFDWNDALWDRVLRDRNFLFSPVHISVKLMQWWLSPDQNKLSFKKGSEKIFPDKKTWFPVAKNDDDSGNSLSNDNLHLNPKRQNSDDFPHIIMFIPKQDRLVDGERLINHFINHEANSVYKIWYIDEYSHLDVLWAHDVIDRIGKPMIENMRFPNAK